MRLRCETTVNGGGDELERLWPWLSEIERPFKSRLERDFEVERVGSEIEKATIVVVLVIGVMSSRYWVMEAQVRESV